MKRDSLYRVPPVSKRASQFLLPLTLILSMVGLGYLPTSLAKDTGKTTAGATAKKPAAAEKKVASGKPTIYEFGASYCVPCKVFAPTFEKIKGQYSGKAEFHTVNIDDDANKQLVEKYKVLSVPKFVILDGTGKIKYQHDGAVDEKTLTDEINKVVGK